MLFMYDYTSTKVMYKCVYTQRLATQVCIEGGTCTDDFETLPYYRMEGTMLSLLDIVLIIYSLSHVVTGTTSVIAAVPWQSVG